MRAAREGAGLFFGRAHCFWFFLSLCSLPLFLQQRWRSDNRGSGVEKRARKGERWTLSARAALERRRRERAVDVDGKVGAREKIVDSTKNGGQERAPNHKSAIFFQTLRNRGERSLRLFALSLFAPLAKPGVSLSSERLRFSSREESIQRERGGAFRKLFSLFITFD